MNKQKQKQRYLQGGVPRSKLVLGIGAYGRGWTLRSTSSSGMGAPASGPSPKTVFTNEAGFLAFYEIRSLIANKARVVFDLLSQTVYVVSGRTWASYDDASTLAIKATLIHQQSLMGAMIWAIDLDDFNTNNTIGRTMNIELARRRTDLQIITDAPPSTTTTIIPSTTSTTTSTSPTKAGVTTTSSST